jgi:hypothetical protein
MQKDRIDSIVFDLLLQQQEPDNKDLTSRQKNYIKDSSELASTIFLISILL